MKVAFVGDGRPVDKKPAAAAKVSAVAHHLPNLAVDACLHLYKGRSAVVGGHRHLGARVVDLGLDGLEGICDSNIKCREPDLCGCNLCIRYWRDRSLIGSASGRVGFHYSELADGPRASRGRSRLSATETGACSSTALSPNFSRLCALRARSWCKHSYISVYVFLIFHAQ